MTNYINQIIALFLPSFIALKILDHLCRNLLRAKDLIIYYFILNIFINLSLYIITIYVFANPIIAFDDQFTIKYLTVAIVLSIVYPILLKTISKSITIRVEEHKKCSKK